MRCVNPQLLKALFLVSLLTLTRLLGIPNNHIDAAGSSPLECGGLTPLFLVAARRDIGPMSVIAAAIALRKEMKLFIRARCQATANESGVKPPHSKATEHV